MLCLNSARHVSESLNQPEVAYQTSQLASSTIVADIRAHYLVIAIHGANPAQIFSL
jgi:hypothetical protein